MSRIYYQRRFISGVLLFLRVLVSYRLLGLRNALSSRARGRERLKVLHARNALLLREEMTEKRGIFIKIGQFLSSRVDLLPEEYTAELSKLQDQVPPAPFADIARRVTEELGPLTRVFSSFDEQPIASASLGQVHRACLRDGDCVVVKVQYPGIENIIDADIRTLNAVFRIMKFLYSHVNLDVIYTEFSRVVHEELDYLQEGRNAETFLRNFRDNPKIKIPIVYWPFTTAKVLTLEEVAGVKITDLEEIDRRGIDRAEVARTLAEAYARMFFVDGFFHGDPHPGNIFVQPGPLVVFVDFGMVDRIRGPMREGLKRAFLAVVDSDSLAFVRSLVDMGFIPLTGDLRPIVQLVDRLFLKYRSLSLSEFKAMDLDEIGDDILASLRISPSLQIPNDFILFGRVVGMLNGLASRLNPETNIIEIATPFARRFIRSGGQDAGAVFKRTAAVGRSLFRLPHLVENFLVTTGRGETRVEITSEAITRELRAIARIGKGFILALLAAGAGLAALVLRLNALPVESLAAAAFAAALVLWVFLLIRRT